jgi:hypothetical protein
MRDAFEDVVAVKVMQLIDEVAPQLNQCCLNRGQAAAVNALVAEAGERVMPLLDHCFRNWSAVVRRVAEGARQTELPRHPSLSFVARHLNLCMEARGRQGIFVHEVNGTTDHDADKTFTATIPWRAGMKNVGPVACPGAGRGLERPSPAYTSPSCTCGRTLRRPGDDACRSYHLPHPNMPGATRRRTT